VHNKVRAKEAIMNLMDLRSFDIAAYIKGLLGAPGGSKKASSKILLWSLLGVSILLMYIYFIFLPYLDERSQIQKMVSAIPEMEANIKYLEVANKNAHDDLVQTEISYLDLNRRFSTEPQLEDLYQKLSQMAASQGLVISLLSADGEDAIFTGGKALASNQTQPVPAIDPATNLAPPTPAPLAPLFYRVRIKLEMSGGYNRYMRYRKLLSEFGKVVNIDKEQISLVKGDVHGMVSVKTQLSVYKLPEKLQIKKTVSSTITLQGIQVGDGLRVFDASLLNWLTKSSKFTWSFISSANAAETGTGVIKIGNAAQVTSSSATGSPSNERDPFSRSSSGMIEGGRDPRYSPLTMADPQTYVITGVMVSSNAKAAMIKTDFRESFVVKIGDRLGNQGATIVDIDLEGVILRQPGGGRLRLYIQSQSGQYPLTDSSKGVNGGAR
jgi:Tfp pilus assembly protein PilO